MKKMNDLKYGEYVDELNKAPTLEEIFERYKD